MIGQLRSTYRYQAKPNLFKDHLRNRIFEIATEFGRYGYRKVTDMLNNEGYAVGKDRVYTIWREEGAREAAKARKTLACRWFMHKAKARVSQSCVEL